MFLVNLEVPVVITALVSITNDLHGFENVAWILSSYLLGYVGSFGSHYPDFLPTSS